MPFVSKAQHRYFFWAEKRGKLPKGTAMEWAHHTPDIKALPEHKKKANSTAAPPAVGATPAASTSNNLAALLVPALVGGLGGAAYGAYQAPGHSRARGALIGGLGGAGAGLGLSGMNTFLNSPHAKNIDNSAVRSAMALGGAAGGLSAGLGAGRHLSQEMQLGDDQNTTKNDLSELDPMRRKFLGLPAVFHDYLPKRAAEAAEPVKKEPEKAESSWLPTATGALGVAAGVAGSYALRQYRSGSRGPVSKPQLQLPKRAADCESTSVSALAQPSVRGIAAINNRNSDISPSIVAELDKLWPRPKPVNADAGATKVAATLGPLPFKREHPWTLRISNGKSTISRSPVVGKPVPGLESQPSSKSKKKIPTSEPEMKCEKPKSECMPSKTASTLDQLFPSDEASRAALLKSLAGGAALAAAPAIYGAATAPEGHRLHGAGSAMEQTEGAVKGGVIGGAMGGLGGAGLAALAKAYGVNTPGLDSALTLGGAGVGAVGGGYGGLRLAQHMFPGPVQQGLDKQAAIDLSSLLRAPGNAWNAAKAIPGSVSAMANRFGSTLSQAGTAAKALPGQARSMLQRNAVPIAGVAATASGGAALSPYLQGQGNLSEDISKGLEGWMQPRPSRAIRSPIYDPKAVDTKSVSYQQGRMDANQKAYGQAQPKPEPTPTPEVPQPEDPGMLGHLGAAYSKLHPAIQYGAPAALGLYGIQQFMGRKREPERQPQAYPMPMMMPGGGGGGGRMLLSGF